MNFEIVTDSSANLTDQIIERYSIKIMSLSYDVEGVIYKSYIENKKTDLTDFYAMMRDKKNITTSCVSPDTCREVMEGVLKSGKDILYIGFSSALSATYQVAAAVAEDLKQEYPDRKILCVDTLSASLGEGMLVMDAAKQRESGESLEDIYNWVLGNRLKVCHWFTVDDMFFLKRGGRISGATAVVTTVLSIKPVMRIDDTGKLLPAFNVRGRKNALKALVEQMESQVVEPENQEICISHADCEDEANELARMIREKFKVSDIIINYIEPVIGSHSGPGTLALFFIGRQR